MVALCGTHLRRTAGIGHLVVVLGAMAVVALSRRSPLGAEVAYAPRVVWALPSLLIVPLVWRTRWIWMQALTLSLVFGPWMGLHLSLPRQGKPDLTVLTW